MPPFLYRHDDDMLGRVLQLEKDVLALKTGGILRPTSPAIRSNTVVTGAWPQSITFTPVSITSTVWIIWQVTGFVTAAGSITCTLSVDGTVQDTSTRNVSTANVHVTLPFGVASVGALTIASHTVLISQTAGTSDSTDKGRILVIEVP